MTSSATRDASVLRRVLAECHQFRGRLVAIFVLGLLATPLALLVPVSLLIAVDSVIGSNPPPGLLADLIPVTVQESTWGLLMFAAVLHVAVVVLEELRVTADEVLRTMTGERVTLGFRARLLGHAQRLSFAFHDRRGTSDSIHRIQYDAPAIRHIVLDGMLPLIAALITVIGMVYVMILLDPQVALIAIAISPLLYWAVGTFRRRTRPEYRRVKHLESSALGVVQEVLTSLRVVQAYGRELDENERFVGVSTEGVRQQIRLVIAERLFTMLVRTLTALGTAAVLYVGIRNVQDGSLTLGEFLVIFSYIGRLYEPLRTVARRSASMQRHMAGAERALELLDETPDVAERADAKALARATGAIRFENVYFAYDSETEVLSDISFDIPAGCRVGIRGETGSGKTTLVSLLSRFYDPTQGRILLDGVDLRDLRLDDLRRQFAIMLQEPVLFSATIAENIAYARPRASQDEIEAATMAAGAHEFVSQLPHAYATTVGERGMRLSGGERQRISLARAFLKDAPILILDEPTSSVDLTTEAAIMQHLERLMQGRTTFMIAHRTSTLEACEVVLELADGRLSGIDGQPVSPEDITRDRTIRSRARWPIGRRHRTRRVGVDNGVPHLDATSFGHPADASSVVPVVRQSVCREADRVVLEILGEHGGGLSATAWQAGCRGVATRSSFQEARHRLARAGFALNEGTERRTRYVLTDEGLEWLTAPDRQELAT